jgi:hypothetical protein
MDAGVEEVGAGMEDESGEAGIAEDSVGEGGCEVDNGDGGALLAVRECAEDETDTDRVPSVGEVDGR